MTKNNAINANSITPLPIEDGGTGVNAVTTTPTAGAYAGWDANSNLSTNNLIEGYTTTATAAGVTTLTVTSSYQQFFTGITTQTVVMPVTSTLVTGQSWLIINNSTGIVTVQSSGANTIIAMNPGTQAVITCILTSGTTAASWSFNYSSNIGGVISITGTANQVIASAATGDITLSLPQSIAITSSPRFSNVQITNSILDSNAKKSITIVPEPNAVNFINTYNDIAGSPNFGPGIGADGTDTNVSLYLAGKGTSPVQIFGDTGLGGTTPIAFYNGFVFQHKTLFSFATNAATRTVTFPDASFTVADNSATQTWTPVFTFATPEDLSVVYSTQEGTYCKVGSTITVSWSLIFIPTFTTSSGNIVITGLPFTSNSGCIYTGSVIYVNVSAAWPTGITNISSILGQSDNKINVVGCGSAVLAQYLTTANVTSGASIQISGTLVYTI